MPGSRAGSTRASRSSGGWVRSHLRGLTLRGRAFVAAGAATVAVSVLLGQRDLLRLGLLLTLLPLLGVWAVARTRYRLACTRQVDPARVPAGQESRVLLRLDNVARLPTGLLLVEDEVPYVLGSRPRFVLDRVEPRGHRAVSYPVRSEVRGRYLVGPLSLRLTDPFGMCELRRSFTAQDALVVTPQVQTLPPVPLGGEWSSSGESRSRSMAMAGEDDVATREYRHGDALHRVHWRSTARYGELMVRREEQPWQSRCTLLLDTRARAHRGEGPGSSFEWAVAATASLGVHLHRRGYAVRLVTDTGATVSAGAREPDGAGTDVEGALLDALAVVTASSGPSLRQVAPQLRHGGDNLLVAVLGALDVEEAENLARVHHAPATGVAVLLDVPTWTARRARTRGPGAGAASGDTASGVEVLLRRAGWRVVVARCGDDLPSLWARTAVGGRDLTSAGTAGTGAP